MSELAGQIAIVTGGARGIGGATAKRFVEEGATVILADVLDDVGREHAKALGERAHYVHLDVTEESAWRTLIKDTVDSHGRIDILVNNAGIGGGRFELLEDLPLDYIRQLLDINLLGTIIGMQQVIPVMKGQGNGSIINISSSNGLMSANALSIYCTSKWAVRGLTKAAALELGPHGVRVNSIHPGGADTPMSNTQASSRQQFNRNFRNTPLQRACDPDEIVEGIFFFASARGRYCTGSELAIDGGLTAGIYYQGLPGAPS